MIKRQAARKAMADNAGFPRWAPADVVDHMTDYMSQIKHYASNDPRRECPDMLRRLLTYPDMQEVWGALRLSKKPLSAVIFSGAAGHAFCGPRGEERRTPAQHQAWL